jgi:outer membrane protein assembly factor BamB
VALGIACGGCSTTNSSDGRLVAVDPHTGSQLWRARLPMTTVSTPVVSGDLVIVAGLRDCNAPQLTVAAVDAKSGRLLWQRSVPAADPCSGDLAPRIVGHVVVAGGPIGPPGLHGVPNACNPSVTGGIAASGLDVATGKPRWRAPPAAGQIVAATADTVIAISTCDARVLGLDAGTGRIRWSAPSASTLHSFAVARDAVFEGAFLGDGSTLTALEAASGKSRWTVHLPRRDSLLSDHSVAAGDVVVAATTRSDGPTDTFTGLDPATGRRLWRTTLGGTTEQDGQVVTPVGPRLFLVARSIGGIRTRHVIEARDLNTGTRRWVSRDLAGLNVCGTDSTTVVAAEPTRAAGFSTTDGRQLWTKTGRYATCAVTANAVYLATSMPPENEPRGD